jgi:hypothetical protein
MVVVVDMVAAGMAGAGTLEAAILAVAMAAARASVVSAAADGTSALARRFPGRPDEPVSAAAVR